MDKRRNQYNAIKGVEKSIQVAVFYDITGEKEQNLLLEKLKEKVNALKQ